MIGFLSKTGLFGFEKHRFTAFIVVGILLMHCLGRADNIATISIQLNAESSRGIGNKTMRIRGS